MLDYSSQINQFLKSQMKNLDPQLQQLISQMTPEQLNQVVKDSPDLQQALEAQDPQIKQKHTQYYLDKLQEEASEIIQAVSKLRRFGPESHHPDRKESNLQELVGELEDFLALVAALEADKMFDLTHSQERIKKKFQAIYKQ